ncbi:MAG TPA: hypothetical protein VLE50_08325 [Cellvibrio sp.]|nr:hypothetical protein [Cellvibrio sp.]
MLLKKLTPWIIGCALLCAACFIGYQKGVADTTEKNLTAEIGSLNKSLDELQVQTKAAGQLNLQLGKTINARQKADQQSTQVFTNALAATAHLRFNCVFDDNIMQQLFQSADRADQAASSGLVSAMPTGDPPP